MQLARPCLLGGREPQRESSATDLIYWKNSLCISCSVVFYSLRHTLQWEKWRCLNVPKSPDGKQNVPGVSTRMPMDCYSPLGSSLFLIISMCVATVMLGSLWMLLRDEPTWPTVPAVISWTSSPGTWSTGKSEWLYVGVFTCSLCKGNILFTQGNPVKDEGHLFNSSSVL